MIIYIDMDAFFASIEQAINPRLKGKPLIVGSRGNPMHTVVCAASYEAKAFGISSGMPTKEAYQLCPNLEFVAAEQGKYIWTSEQVYKLLQGYGLACDYAAIDEFSLYIEDSTARLMALAKDIQEKIRVNFNITASIGIARNWILAKLASKLEKPQGLAIINEDNIKDKLAKVPVKKLCGIGPKTALIMEVLGIETCLDLYEKDALFMESCMGKFGLNLYASLHETTHFIARETSQRPKSVGHSYTFPSASQNQGFIRAWIRLLSEMVSRRLREQDLMAKTVHIWLECGPEIGRFSSQASSQQPTNDGLEIYLKSLKIMAKSGQIRPKIRAIGITCSNLSKNPYGLLFKEEKRREGLIKAMDRINNRYGEDSLIPAQTMLCRKMK